MRVIDRTCQRVMSRFPSPTGAGILPHMTDLRDRIKQRLDELGISPRAASLAAGMSSDVIRDLFRRPDNSPTVETIRKLAVGLQTTPEWLAFGSYEVGTLGGKEGALPSQLHGPELIEVAVTLKPAAYGGVVEAGSFRPVDEFGDIEPPTRQEPPDSEFPDAEVMFFDVAGDSMNKLKPRPIMPGDRVFALNFASLRNRVALRDGMVVVVQQTIDGGQHRERSVKQLELYEDRMEFHPRSDNPRHKPIVISRDYTPEDGKEVEIFALVRRISNDIPLS